MKSVNFNTLAGETIVSAKGLEKGSDKVIFRTLSNRVFKMYHDQDCCEDVSIDDIVGDINDIIGNTVVVAEEVIGKSGDDANGDHYTWTFYKIDTIKGGVTIKWYGFSNGYYSESVEFVDLFKGEE